MCVENEKFNKSNNKVKSVTNSLDLLKERISKIEGKIEELLHSEEIVKKLALKYKF